MRSFRCSSLLLLALLLATAPLQAQTRVATLAPLPTATPESVGFAPGALDKMDAGMQDLVDKKHLAGIVTLVARKGKVVQHKAYGVQSLETGAPMKTDTIARIYSMTKPITGVAMMMLYDEGKWKPSDPIAKHIPAVRQPEGLRRRERRPADPRSAGASADDGRVDVAFGGLHLRPVRQHAGGRDLPGEQPAGGAVTAGDDRPAVDDAAALSAGNEMGLQRIGGHPGLSRRKTLGQDVP